MKKSIFRSSILGLFVVIIAIYSCDNSNDSNSTTVDNVTANKKLAVSFVNDFLNAKNPDSISSIGNRILSPDYIQHNATVPPGRNGLIQFQAYLGACFPNSSVTLRDAFATNDRVVARWTFTGTLTGPPPGYPPFLGIAATGQNVEFDVIDIWTVKDGKLYEHWDQIDWARGFIELGIQGLPQPFIDAAALPYNR